MKVYGGKKEVAVMAWPLAVGMLSITLMSVVDTLLMGHVSTPAQAGVGIATLLCYFFLTFFFGIAGGTQSQVAASFGANDKKRMQSAGSSGVMLGIGAGIFAALLLAAIYKPILALMVPDQEIAGSTIRYLEVRLFGMPFSILAIGFLAGIQGMGDTKTRMWVSFAGNGLNIVLDLILIFGFGPIPAMGEAGAALATVAGAMTMAALYALRHFKLFGKPVLPEKEVIISSLKLGLPAAFEHLLGIMAFSVITFTLARISAAHLAASEIVISIVSISFLPGEGIGEAGGILIGRYIGAGRTDRAAKTLGSARCLAIGVMGICGIAFAFFGHEIASLFTKDPEVAEIAGALMIYAAVFQLFDANAIVHLCALRAAGDIRFMLIVTTVCAWGLTVPLTIWFGYYLGWGAKGAYLGLTLEIIVLAIITGIRARGIKSGKVGRVDLLLGRKCETT